MACSSVQAAPTPTDTLPGHAQLVRAISASLCTQLANDHTTNVAKMSSPDAMAYVQGLFVKAMQADSVHLLAMMSAAAERGIQPMQVGQALGRDAMLEITKNCPASRPLAVRLSQTEQGQQAMAANMPKLAAAEQKALLPVTVALCAELDASNAKTPFAQLTPAGRQRVFIAAMQKAFKLHTAALNRFYGPAKLDELLRSGEFDGKVASLMAQQGKCSQYLVLIGSDRLAEEKKP